MDESRRVVLERADQLQAPLALLGRDFSNNLHGDGSWDYHSSKENQQSILDLRSGLSGGYQADNSSIALATLEILADHGFEVDDHALRKGLQDVRWPGRLEYQVLNGRRYLLDGAHNPAGVISLKESLENEFPYQKLILVWASMVDKDIKKSLLPLAPLADTIILTMPEQIRSARPEMIKGLLPPERHDDCFCLTEVDQALAKAHELAGPDDLICVAGSLYLVGKARFMLLGEVVE